MSWPLNLAAVPRFWLAAGMVTVGAVAGIGQDQAATNLSPAWRAVFSQIQREWPKVPQMSTAALARQLKLAKASRPFLIDVRGPDEFAVSHLSDAVNAQSPAGISALVKGVPTDRAVVLYCSVGIRSSRAAARLLETGRTNVFNLKGSIFQWANENRPLEKAGKAVTEVHAYNKRWGRMLDPSHHPKEGK